MTLYTPMSCCQFANLVRFVVAFGLVAAAVVFALGQCRTLNVSAPSQSVLSRDASSLLWILSQTESALQWRQRELQVCLARRHRRDTCSAPGSEVAD